MECYAANLDYNGMMELTEELYEFIAKKVLGKTKVEYQGIEIDFKAPWKRITMYDAIKEHGKIDVTKLSDKELLQKALSLKLEVNEKTPRGLIIQHLFEELVEKHLIQPTFIIDHPKETTALCKVKRGNPDLIERFEPFIYSWEIGNAYSELNDPQIQYELFREQEEQGRGGNEEFHPMDEDYVRALEIGLPPTGGVGLGIDRMIMLLTNSATIRDVILFPTMRPQIGDAEEVEKIEIQEQETIVIGKIIEMKNHPNADNLKICKVDVGTKKLTSITNCKNAREGLLVAVIPPGTKYLDWKGSGKILTAKKTELRGIESEIVMAGPEEIGIYVDEDKREFIYEVKNGKPGDKLKDILSK